MTINKNSPTYSILFFTTVVFGFALALNFAHAELKDSIEEAKQQEINKILTENMQCKNYIETNINNNDLYYCKNSNIVALHTFSRGYIDKIEYIALFDIEKNVTKNINIINHKETPGLGDKIMTSSWLLSIYDKGSELLKLKKHGGEIDSITAASVTPMFFLGNLQQNLFMLETNKIKINQLITE